PLPKTALLTGVHHGLRPVCETSLTSNSFSKLGLSKLVTASRSAFRSNAVLRPADSTFEVPTCTISSDTPGRTPRATRRTTDVDKWPPSEKPWKYCGQESLFPQSCREHRANELSAIFCNRRVFVLMIRRPPRDS